MSGGELKDDGFGRIGILAKLQELLDQSVPLTPDDEMLSEIRKRYDRDREGILAAVEARSKDRMEFLSKSLEKRKSSDIQDISTVLAELEKSIRSELQESAKMVQQELSLWPENERAQLRRDVDALKARLQRIPEERERESEAISFRYADPVHRTFPVAVEFIIPSA
jgi:hypothetical protein